MAWPPVRGNVGFTTPIWVTNVAVVVKIIQILLIRSVGGSRNYVFGVNYTYWTLKNNPFYLNDTIGKFTA